MWGFLLDTFVLSISCGVSVKSELIKAHNTSFSQDQVSGLNDNISLCLHCEKSNCNVYAVFTVYTTYKHSNIKQISGLRNRKIGLCFLFLYFPSLLKSCDIFHYKNKLPFTFSSLKLSVIYNNIEFS